MGGSAKPPKPTDAQVKNEKLSAELMKAQLEAAKKPVVLPEIKPPTILPQSPPPIMLSGEAANAAEAQRRKAANRTNTGRNTIFAGETGGYNKSKSILA